MLSKSKLVLVLKICVFLVFIGRAYQYIFFNAPFRAILWDESLMSPIIEGLFNTPWREYATSGEVDKWIQRSVVFNGFIYIAAAFSALFINTNNRKYLKHFIWLGGFLLIVLSLLTTKDKFYHYGQFFEHAIQFGTPFLLVAAVKGLSVKKLSLYLKTLIAVTFTSHGLYALGYYPIPGYFIDMTIRGFGVTEDTAVIILNMVGALDILLSILIFVPKVAKYFLWYAFIWGIATALARIVATIDVDFMLHSMHQSLYKVIYRLPHGIIPLFVFYIDRKNKKQFEENITYNTP